MMHELLTPVLLGTLHILSDARAFAQSVILRVVSCRLSYCSVSAIPFFYSRESRILLSLQTWAP